MYKRVKTMLKKLTTIYEFLIVTGLHNYCDIGFTTLLFKKSKIAQSQGGYTEEIGKL